MKKRKLREYVTFVPGINPTRAGKQFDIQEIQYYDQSAFESDLVYGEEFKNGKNISSSSDISLEVGDVVISNSMQLATMVGCNNAGKIPTLNFTKVVFHNNDLDKRYFIYLFNAYNDVKRQKDRELQGSGSILRIPLKALNEIVIPIVTIEEQMKIGMVYREVSKLQSKLGAYADMIEQYAESILEDTLREK